MERILGMAVYTLGLIMMVTMVLNAMGILNQAGPLPTVGFIIFGYILCVTGYFFTRKSPPLS